jgi:hypothetical protein
MKNLLLSRFVGIRAAKLYLLNFEVCCSNIVHAFQNFSSRMAAIDYSVCVHSEVFVTTQGGNFPQFLLGHRRYLYGGHSKTIKPDKRRLAILFDSPRIGYVYCGPWPVLHFERLGYLCISSFLKS